MAWIGWMALAVAVPDEVVLARAREAVGGSGVQTRLPRVDAGPSRTEVVDTTPRTAVVIPDAITAVANVVTWSLILLGLVWLAVHATHRIGHGSRDVAAPMATAPSPRRRHAPDPDVLAAAGRHGEAIRGLLRRALELAAAGQTLPPGSTSRELVAALAIDAEARRALADLVRCAERHAFEGIAAGPVDYARCLARWRHLRGRLP